jgi:transcriptional regulator with XRE-family HTH domain
MADLSMTHMSHVETGNTKVSLPALLAIANALKVTLDALVYDSLARAKENFEGELLRHTQDCDEYEIRIITDTIKSLKESLRKRDRQ